MVNDDFLDEMIAERSQGNPEFPRLLDEAVRRRGQRTKRAPERDALSEREDPK